MAKLASIFCTMGMFALAALRASPADTTYRDPGNPSFSVVVPNGWNVARTDSGLTLNHGANSVTLLVISDIRPAADILANLVSQMRIQAKNFHELEKGECRFGGQSGAYELFSGINPNGITEQTKVVTMTNGHRGYAMIQETPSSEYESQKRDLQRIQDTFAPEAPSTAQDNRETIAANPNSAESTSLPESNQAKFPGTPGNDQVQRYSVVHFALSSTGNWMTDNCNGWMTINNGMISYQAVSGRHGLHSFQIPIKDIKEVKKNSIMGAALMSFHIRLKSGENYNFSLIDDSGQYWQNPTVLLDAIRAGMK